MRAGSLNRSIAIQRLTETVGAAGTVSRQWEIIAVLRAELINATAAESGTKQKSPAAVAGTGSLSVNFGVGITQDDGECKVSQVPIPITFRRDSTLGRHA
jgi:hypothetical protein